MLPLTEAQKIMLKLAAVAVAVLAVIAYGMVEHHRGYAECKAEYAAKAEQLKKESRDAIAKEQDQAITDKQFLAAYYNRLLSARPAVPRGSVQTTGASGVPAAPVQCGAAEPDLQLEQRCAEDAAKLVRVKEWARQIGGE